MTRKEEYYDIDQLKKITDKEFTFRLANQRIKNINEEFRNLGIPFGFYGAYIVNKKSLYYLGCMVKEHFNSCCFRSKSTNSIQHINNVEVIEHGTAVYFWCSHMNNFVVFAGTKKQTYKRLIELLMHICANEHEDHIDISDFIVKR